MFSPTEKQDLTSNARELFVRAIRFASKPTITDLLQENLSLKPAPVAPAPARSPEQNGFRPPPDSASRVRPDRADRPHRMPSSREPPPGRPAESRSKDPFDIFADPSSMSKTAAMAPRDRIPRRPRRNSESSVMDRTSKLFDDDDKRRRERRHRERDGRHRDGKHRSSRKNRQLDIIDKLDVTSIYGTGSKSSLFMIYFKSTLINHPVFHHDGPFDACNPHRNRKGVRTAPMQAFPKNSTNMALGGAGPNNSNIDLNLFHGRMEEGYNDFSTSGLQRSGTVNFDPTQNVEPIHGAESYGLGTSTFLDGTPASRAAIARRQSETEQQVAQGGGLQRKKSLAQRLRGKSGTGRVVSPGESGLHSPGPTPAGSSHSTSSRGNERNPFFQDYDEEWDKKGSRIQEARLEVAHGRVRSSSSPKRSIGLERKSTNDRPAEESKLNAGGGGFLNRMKSLRKPRPERRTSD